MKQALTQLSQHIWLWPFAVGKHIIQANVGIVRGNQQTVLIDAGNGAPLAQRIQQALHANSFPPISHIIYTHHHWDHVFGAYCFAPPEIIANQRSIPFLQQKAAIDWNGRYLQAHTIQQSEHTQAQHKAAGNWATFRIQLPTITFDQTHTLTLDNGLTLTLKHVPSPHSPDATVVGIPSDGLRFVGDAHYPPPDYEATATTQTAVSATTINAFLEERYHTYIDGHNAPITAAHMRRLAQASQLLHHHRRQNG